MARGQILMNVKWVGARPFAQNLRSSPTLVQANTNRALRAIGRVYIPVLKGETPVRTGKLRRVSVFSAGTPQDQRLEIRQSARNEQGQFYGQFVRSGTRAHIIRPVRDKVLRFVVGGKVIFAKQVNHPGTKPNPYHLRALRRVQGQIQAIVRQAGVNITAQLADVRGL